MDSYFYMLLLGLPGIVGIAGLLGVKRLNQARSDEMRQHYTVEVPTDTDFASVANFMRSLGGIKLSRARRLTGVPTITFEIESNASGLTHRLAVPYHLASQILGDLHTCIPGATVEKTDGSPHDRWDKAMELGLSSHRIPLNIPDPVPAIENILGKFMPLEEGQGLLMQWVISPGEHEASGNDKQHQKKFEGHQMFMGVGRIAARAETPEEAQRLIGRLRSGLTHLHAFGISFQAKKIPVRLVHARIEGRRSLIGWPATFNEFELATLAGFPAGAKNVQGLPTARTRQIAVDRRIPTEGTLIGYSNFHGQERRVAMTPKDRLRHVHIVGPSGTGKSEVIINMAEQDMSQGFGIAVFDPNGDTVSELLDRVPANRIDDVIVIDLTDSQRPIGINVLEGDDPYLVTSQIMGVFDALFDVGKMPRTGDILRSSALTLAHLGLTLMDVPRLLAPDDKGRAFRFKAVRKIKDPALRAFWNEYDAMKTSAQSDAIAPLLRRLRPLELRPSLRAVLGQANSGFSFKNVLDEGKILFIALPKGQIGEETAALFGSLFFSKLWQAIQGRSALPINERKPFFCFIDEFQDFLNTGMSVTDVMVQARKYGAGLHLAHQNLGQLGPNLRDSVLANAGNKITFRLQAGDGSVMSREFPSYMTAADFSNLGKFEVVAQVVADDQVMPPATVKTVKAAPPTGSFRAAHAASRERYGRTMAEVNQEMQERLEAFESGPQKPSVEWEDDE